MTHYIIDSKKRQEYLYLFLIFMIASFGLGYTFGYLHGVPEDEITTVSQVKESSSTDKNKPLPTQAAKLKDNAKTNTPVKKPIHKTTVPTKTQQITTKEVKSKPIKVATPIKSKPLALSTKKIPSKKVSSTPKSTTEKNKPNESENSQPENSEKPVNKSVNANDESSSQYVIQVGLFAGKENASDFVEKLEESGFKTFYEAFISTSGEEKYNVRLGPYSEKTIAQKKMAEFQKLHDTSAYILTKK